MDEKKRKKVEEANFPSKRQKLNNNTKNWSRHTVYRWALNQNNVDVEDAEILQKNKVDGETLLALTYEKLYNDAKYNLPDGPATSLALAINQLCLQIVESEWQKLLEKDTKCLETIKPENWTKIHVFGWAVDKIKVDKADALVLFRNEVDGKMLYTLSYEKLYNDPKYNLNDAHAKSLAMAIIDSQIQNIQKEWQDGPIPSERIKPEYWTKIRVFGWAVYKIKVDKADALILYRNGVDGKILLSLRKEDLLSEPYKLIGRTAFLLCNGIDELHTKHETLLKNTIQNSGRPGREINRMKKYHKRNAWTSLEEEAIIEMANITRNFDEVQQHPLLKKYTVEAVKTRCNKMIREGIILKCRGITP